MNDKFLIWDFADVEGAYVPDELRDEDDESFDVLDVFSEKNIPKGLHFYEDEDYIGDELMLDSFGNTESVIPISLKLKKFFEDKKIPNLIFIPVKMLNDKDKVLGEYYLLHTTNVIDVINKDETQLRVDSLNEKMYNLVRNLVLIDDKIPKNTQIFRVKGLYDVTCISQGLVKEIKNCGFTGIVWKKVSDYRY